ncbi:DUF5979 domain-containing protein [Streptomyces sp. AC495_CC817]|uniref:DUF5979 domain-containing protein n=1 Tax=Streptomyces sp. AC495_CC817 TaxID=2823900 RepID=UPI001C26E7A6|nr:DUF5979 domain-containing protein [Streptomyces sp. AC495_CC817]
MLRNIRRHAAIAAVLALIGVGAGAAAAVAADYDHPGAVDPSSITVTNIDGGDVHLGTRVRIDAAWSIPDGAAAGETFGFVLPSEFAGFTTSFAIPAQDDPSATVAECTVSGDAAPVVTCTLTDYVAGRTGVAGSLWFVVQADESTTDTTVDFVVDGTVTPVTLPGGGGIGTGGTLPENPEKWSYVTADGRIAWTLVLPGSSFVEADSIVIDDVLAPADDQVAAHHNVDGDLRVWATDATGSETRDVPGWSGAWNAEGTSFHLEIPGPIDPEAHYMVKYFTVPVSPSAGATFGNTASINGVTIDDRQVWVGSGGGAGEGTRTGSVTVTKLLSGTGSSAVPSDARYTVSYSYGDPVVTRTLEVTAGRTSSAIVLPVGTVVTLSEAAPPAVAGIDWGRPVFGGQGVRTLDDGRAQVTIGEGAAASVTLTNTATVVTPERPVQPARPTPPPVPKELPLTGTLASTGADAPLPILLAGGGALLLGLAMTAGAALRRRRR